MYQKKNVHAVDKTDGFFKQWSTYKEIELYLSMLVKNHKKNKFVKLHSIGKSAEHRSLSMLTLGPLNGDVPKYQLMLMGTMHGREWISPHALVYLCYKILKGIEEQDDKTLLLLKETQVHILPMLNPDGYEFTRSDKENAREWRKNRRNLCSKCDRGVHGIDLNRNWGIKGKSWGFGADRATSEVYQGKRPFSEPEIVAVKNFLLKGKRGKAINGFMDVHCCSGEVLPPFYYSRETEEIKLKNLENSKAIAKAMKAVNKKRYKSRPREAEFSDSNTGIGLDWIYAEAGVQNAFMVETRGNKTKLLKYIFEVPEEFILPISRELEAGFWKMAELVTNLPIQNQESIDINSIELQKEQIKETKNEEKMDQIEQPKNKQIQKETLFAQSKQKSSAMSLDEILNTFSDTFDVSTGISDSIMSMSDNENEVSTEKTSVVINKDIKKIKSNNFNIENDFENNKNVEEMKEIDNNEEEKKEPEQDLVDVNNKNPIIEEVIEDNESINDLIEIKGNNEALNIEEEESIIPKTDESLSIDYNASLDSSLYFDGQSLSNDDHQLSLSKPEEILHSMDSNQAKNDADNSNTLMTAQNSQKESNDNLSNQAINSIEVLDTSIESLKADMENVEYRNKIQGNFEESKIVDDENLERIASKWLGGIVENNHKSESIDTNNMKHQKSAKNNNNNLRLKYKRILHEFHNDKLSNAKRKVGISHHVKTIIVHYTNDIYIKYIAMGLFLVMVIATLIFRKIKYLKIKQLSIKKK